MKFQPKEVDDAIFAKHLEALEETSPVLQIFKLYDHVTLMLDDEVMVSYRVLCLLKKWLEAAMIRDGVDEAYLNNHALWRDPDCG